MRFASGEKPRDRVVIPKSDKTGTRMHPNVVEIAKNANSTNNSQAFHGLEPSNVANKDDYKSGNLAKYNSMKNGLDKDSKTLPAHKSSSMTKVPDPYKSAPDLNVLNLVEDEVSSASHIVITKEIGTGAFGGVYECTIKALGNDRKFAVKKQPGDEKNLLEADILKKYRHPNIVNMYAYFKEKDPLRKTKQFDHYLVMEKFTTSLGREIAKRATENRTFKEKEVHLILESVVNGLHFLHSHKNPIMHRDVKVRIFRDLF